MIIEYSGTVPTWLAVVIAAVPTVAFAAAYKSFGRPMFVFLLLVMILLATTNCEPAMSPHGGCEAYFGTNPIAASFPTGKGFHVKIDLATSIVAVSSPADSGVIRTM